MSADTIRPAIGVLKAPRTFAWPGADTAFWPAISIAIMLAAHFALARGRAINWDEFFHYSQVHAFVRGDWLQPLQTLHARVFVWALEIPGGPIDQIVAIRIVVFGFLLAAAGAIYAIARRFADRPTALGCVLLYLSAGFVLQHGTSFRADALVAGMLMVALALLLRAKLGVFAILVIATLCAVATLESIKVVLYAPAFLGVAWLRWSEGGFDRATLIRLVAVPVTALTVFGLLYLAHAESVVTSGSSGEAAKAVVSNSSRKMFSIGGLPYYQFIAKAALLALVFAILVVATPLVLRRSSFAASERVALAGLWLPITAVAFYHNTAPYFYVFILAPVAAACAPALSLAAQRYSLRAITLLLVVGALALLAIEDRRAQDNQRAVIAATQEIFDQPVAYFDFPAMLGSWPKANHFMTPWGQDGYLARQAPSFREIMQSRTVPLVIENSVEWEQLLRTRGASPAFLPEDVAALREGFIRYWGPLFVAGRRMEAGSLERSSEFLVPGPYTVHGAAMRVNGRVLAPGSVVELSRGVHRIGPAGPGTGFLVWGAHPGKPSEPAPSSAFWAEF